VAVDRPESNGQSTADNDAQPRPSTRQRILQASLEMFATRGFAGTDIVDIESAVGLTPGSGGFYRHFKNKQDVLEAVIETELERIHAYHQTLEVLPPRHEPDLEVTDRIARMLDMLWEMRHFMEVIAHDNARFPELLSRIRSAMGDGGVAIDAADLSRLMDAGALPRRPPDVVATIMLMAAVGYTRTAMLFGRPVADVDRDEFARVLTDLVLGRPST
jgi:AcrR family transcriptional regulator